MSEWVGQIVANRGSQNLYRFDGVSTNVSASCHMSSKFHACCCYVSQKVSWMLSGACFHSDVSQQLSLLLFRGFMSTVACLRTCHAKVSEIVTPSPQVHSIDHGGFRWRYSADRGKRQYSYVHIFMHIAYMFTCFGTV